MVTSIFMSRLNKTDLLIDLLGCNALYFEVSGGAQHSGEDVGTS